MTDIAYIQVGVTALRDPVTGAVMRAVPMYARAADKAIELLLRLKIGQFDVLPQNLMVPGSEGYCEHRDAAKQYLDCLERVFATYCHKDDEWHRLYDLHQVIRKAIHDAEHPETVGVDSYPVMNTCGEKMARMEAIGDD